MRNVYSLIDFGKLRSQAPKGSANPFIQMIPLTDVNQAHKEFVDVRLNGNDNTNDASQQLLPADQGKASPQSDAEKKAILLEKVLSRWPYILMGSLLLFTLSVGFCVWKCCCKRCREKRKRAAMNKSGERSSVIEAALPLSAVKGQGPYRPLQDPPPSAVNLNHPPPPYSSTSSFHEPYGR